MNRQWQILLALAVVVTGCTAQRIADYDLDVDRGAVALHGKFNELFDSLQSTAGTPDGAYQCYTAQYAELRRAIADLQQRAALQSNNQLTGQSLALLEGNLQQLESAHSDGLAPGEVPILWRLFDSELRMLVHLEVAKKRDDTPAGVKP